MEQYYHHKRNITVATNDTDYKERITPGAVMGYFQDIATGHAALAGYAYEDLLGRNLTWVILRMSVKILKHPAVGETLELWTFPERPGPANVDRGYYAYNEAGDLVLCGSSKWCVLDIDTHKIQRIKPVFEKLDPGLFVPNPPFEGANPKIEELTESNDMEGPFPYTVQATDIDRNEHMNNARYGDVVLNACGMEMLRRQSVSRLDINFMSEMFYGDRFDVYKLQKGDVTFLEARKASDIVFRARVEWKD